MTWGLGQFLFGWPARKNPLMPAWLGWVGTIGGLAGLLTDAVYQTGVLAMLQLASFAIWGFAVGWKLLRSGVIGASNPGGR